ncbi:MAG: hypothetical protein NTV30_02620 [Chloroflexi bacterium]|nr:hypothetical protein [Chloroflexota bacterium]
MISVEEALEKVLSYVSVLETEQKPILDSMGQVLAEDIYSKIDVPSSKLCYGWICSSGKQHHRRNIIKSKAF